MAYVFSCNAHLGLWIGLLIGCIIESIVYLAMTWRINWAREVEKVTLIFNIIPYSPRRPKTI